MVASAFGVRFDEDSELAITMKFGIIVEQNKIGNVRIT